jgi:hypothetical protein
VYGEHVIIDGKTNWFGIARFAKDAQRSYNVSRTAITETIAQTPKSKWWATPEQAAGHTAMWAEADKKNYPFMMYNPDPKAPGAPQRMGGADVPVALIQESQIASDEIKAVTGIFSPDLGAGNQASSGRQEIARQNQGAIATFNYQDNLAKGVRRTWEILIDLIPKIYDTERELRILGADGSESYEKINTFVQGESGEIIKINDLAQGRYDVAVTVGPGYSTKRQEAAEAYTNMAQANPQIMGVAGDLVFKSMDLPYAEEIADRLKAVLPPPIQQMLNKDAKVPPEARAVMAQAEQAMQMVQQQSQQIQQAAQELAQEREINEKQKSEIQMLIEKLKTEEAQFQALVAKESAKLTTQQANITVAETNLQMEMQSEDERAAVMQQRDELTVQAANSIDAINSMAAQFMQFAVNALEEVKNKKEQKKPKVIRIESVRENGKLVAVPVYEPEQIEQSTSGNAGM